jgi:hypothetical protein
VIVLVVCLRFYKSECFRLCLSALEMLREGFAQLSGEKVSLVRLQYNTFRSTYNIIIYIMVFSICVDISSSSHNYLFLYSTPNQIVLFSIYHI